MHELFRGFVPLISRQSVAWISFLEADYYVKKYIRWKYHINQYDNIPAKYLMVGSLFVSLFNVLCVMPFDALKTMMQKSNPTVTLQQSTLSIIREAGFSGLFVGWRIRYSLYLLQALFTVDIIERFENKIRYS